MDKSREDTQEYTINDSNLKSKEYLIKRYKYSDADVDNNAITANRQCEDQKYLIEHNTNPRLSDKTKADKLRSKRYGKHDEIDDIKLKNKVINKIVREASGVYDYNIIPLNTNESLPKKVVNNAPIDPDTHPVLRPYAREIADKSNVVSFGHRPSSASRVFNPSTMAIRLHHDEILKNPKKTIGLPVAILQKLLNTPKLPMADINTVIPDNSNDNNIDKNIKKLLDPYELFNKSTNTWISSKDTSNIPKKRRLKPLKSTIDVQENNIDKPTWNDSFTRKNELYQSVVDKHSINKPEKIPFEERLTRFNILSTASDTMLLPFCIEKQQTDKYLQHHKHINQPILSTNPNKLQPIDPSTIHINTILKDYKNHQSGLNSIYKNEEYQTLINNSLNEMNHLTYYSTTELAKLKKKNVINNQDDNEITILENSEKNYKNAIMEASKGSPIALYKYYKSIELSNNNKNNNQSIILTSNNNNHSSLYIPKNKYPKIKSVTNYVKSDKESIHDNTNYVKSEKNGSIRENHKDNSKNNKIKKDNKLNLKNDTIIDDKIDTIINNKIDNNDSKKIDVVIDYKENNEIETTIEEDNRINDDIDNKVDTLNRISSIRFNEIIDDLLSKSGDDDEIDSLIDDYLDANDLLSDDKTGLLIPKQLSGQLSTHSSSGQLLSGQLLDDYMFVIDETLDNTTSCDLYNEFIESTLSPNSKLNKNFDFIDNISITINNEESNIDKKDNVIEKDRIEKFDIKMNDKIDSKVDSSIDNRIDSKVNDKIDNKTEIEIDSKIKSGIDYKISSNIVDKIDSNIDDKIDNNINSIIDNEIDSIKDNNIDSIIDNKIDLDIKSNDIKEIKVKFSEDIEMIDDNLIDKELNNNNIINQINNNEIISTNNELAIENNKLIIDSNIDNNINEKVISPLVSTKSTKEDNPMNSKVENIFKEIIQMESKIDTSIQSIKVNKIDTKIDSPKVNKVDIKIDSPINNKRDSSTNNKIDSPTNNKIDSPTNNKIDSPTNNKIDSPKGSTVESKIYSPKNKIDSPINNKIDSPINNKIDSPINNKANNKINSLKVSTVDKKIESPFNNKIDSPINNNIDSLINNRIDSPKLSTIDKKTVSPINNKLNNKIDSPKVNKIDIKIDSPINNKMDSPINKKIDNSLSSKKDNQINGINLDNNIESKKEVKRDNKIDSPKSNKILNDNISSNKTNYQKDDEINKEKDNKSSSRKDNKDDKINDYNISNKSNNMNDSKKDDFNNNKFDINVFTNKFINDVILSSIKNVSNKMKKQKSKEMYLDDVIGRSIYQSIVNKDPKTNQPIRTITINSLEPLIDESTNQINNNLPVYTSTILTKINDTKNTLISPNHKSFIMRHVSNNHLIGTSPTNISIQLSPKLSIYQSNNSPIINRSSKILYNKTPQSQFNRSTKLWDNNISIKSNNIIENEINKDDNNIGGKLIQIVDAIDDIIISNHNSPKNIDNKIENLIDNKIDSKKLHKIDSNNNIENKIDTRTSHLSLKLNNITKPNITTTSIQSMKTTRDTKRLSTYSSSKLYNKLANQITNNKGKINDNEPSNNNISGRDSKLIHSRSRSPKKQTFSYDKLNLTNTNIIEPIVMNSVIEIVSERSEDTHSTNRGK